MNKLQITITLLFFGIVLINAQSKETKEKLNNLKGDAVKITIETTDDEIDIEGEDAAVLLKRMKSNKNIMIKKLSRGDKDKHGNMMFFEKNGEHGDKQITVDVDIEDKDGEKIVVIKKIVDGKETVTEYKGEEAEKFMKSHSTGESGMEFISESGEHIILNIDVDDLTWVSEDCSDNIEKKVNVEVNNGVKKVTVTTKVKDGEEKVEVYEGAEADEYLEKMEEGHKMEFQFSEDGDKTMKKKKIIIIEKEEEKK